MCLSRYFLCTAHVSAAGSCLLCGALFFRKHSLNGGAFRLVFSIGNCVLDQPPSEMEAGACCACLFLKLCDERPFAVAVKSHDSARYLRDMVVLEGDDHVSFSVDDALL